MAEAPPEAILIRDFRERAPKLSMQQAAAIADFSASRWRQIENGYRMEHGQPLPQVGPALRVARMARTVGVTPHQLAECGRDDAAAELEVLLMDVEFEERLTSWQKKMLAAKAARAARTEK